MTDRANKAWRLSALGWTQKEIGEKLRVDQGLVSKDMKNCQLAKIHNDLGPDWNDLGRRYNRTKKAKNDGGRGTQKATVDQIDPRSSTAAKLASKHGVSEPTVPVARHAGSGAGRIRGASYPSARGVWGATGLHSSFRGEGGAKC